MAITYSISQSNRVWGGFDSPEKIKELLESNSKVAGGNLQDPGEFRRPGRDGTKP